MQFPPIFQGLGEKLRQSIQFNFPKEEQLQVMVLLSRVLHDDTKARIENIDGISYETIAEVINQSLLGRIGRIAD